MSWLRRRCRDDLLCVRTLVQQQGMIMRDSVVYSGLPQRQRGSMVPIEHCQQLLGNIILFLCIKCKVY